MGASSPTTATSTQSPFFFLAPGNINGTSNGSTIRVYEGHLVECIVEINLESHNLVKNIPRESTNGGPSTQRTILNVNSTVIQEYHFPLLTVFIYLFILMYFFHNEWTSKACGGVQTHPSHPLSLLIQHGSFGLSHTETFFGHRVFMRLTVPF